MRGVRNEPIEHLFLSCTFACVIWFGTPLSFLIDNHMHASFISWWESWMERKKAWVIDMKINVLLELMLSREFICHSRNELILSKIIRSILLMLIIRKLPLMNMTVALMCEYFVMVQLVKQLTADWVLGALLVTMTEAFWWKSLHARMGISYHGRGASSKRSNTSIATMRTVECRLLYWF